MTWAQISHCSVYAWDTSALARSLEVRSLIQSLYFFMWNTCSSSMKIFKYLGGASLYADICLELTPEVPIEIVHLALGHYDIRLF